MKKLFLVFLGLFLLISCSKERNLHLTAKNAVTGVPYPGLNYYVVEEKEGNNGTDYTTVATGTLDENGEKIVPVKIRKNRSYVIRLDPPPNWCYMNEVSYSYTIHGEKSPTFDFTFAECAYLKQNITNVNCQGTNDYMILKTSNQVNSLGATGWEFFGCNGYLGDHFSSVPMGKYYFEWHVTRNSITNIYYDTINLTAGEYKTYDINY